jgi:signal transduction histidine kinase
MFIDILNIVHNATTLLFGVFASAAFLGIRLNRKNNLTLLLFSCVSGAIHLFVYQLYGTSFAEQLYPLITHIPLVLLLTLYYKYNATISILSILTAYLCCQISNWIGIAAFALTNQQWIYYSVRICITAIVFVLLIHYVSDITAQLLQKPTRSLMILRFMPFVYYIFDYVTSIYTSLLYSGLEIVGEFLGFVLCLTYLMFLFLYFKEYEANKEAEQRNQIIEMKRVQSEKELEALHRSERAVSILRHDMRHFLLSISSYIENNENEKALDYINEVIHTSDKTALQRYCKNLILSSHEGEMKKKQITFQYTIQIPEKLRISDVDLTALLSNGLENAIHAVSDLPMPKRIIRLDMHMNHDKLLISLKNTYAIKPQIIDGLPYTSEAGHGFGTKSIWYVAEKQNGNCQFMVDDRFFTMRIIL